MFNYRECANTFFNECDSYIAILNIVDDIESKRKLNLALRRDLTIMSAHLLEKTVVNGIKDYLNKYPVDDNIYNSLINIALLKNIPISIFFDNINSNDANTMYKTLGLTDSEMVDIIRNKGNTYTKFKNFDGKTLQNYKTAFFTIHQKRNLLVHSDIFNYDVKAKNEKSIDGMQTLNDNTTLSELKQYHQYATNYLECISICVDNLGDK